MGRDPVFIEAGDKAPAESEKLPATAGHPPPEEKLGGGDITSLEEEISTDDDKPLY